MFGQGKIQMKKIFSVDISHKQMLHTILWIFGITFLIALPAINKSWYPFDEGITLVCSDMITHGGVPYKDFVTPYAPSQYYVLALMFKIFGPSLDVAHLYLIISHTIICTIVFYLTYKISQNKIFSVFIWIVTMSCIMLRLGGSASSMYPFMAPQAVSMLFFIWFLEKNRMQDIFLAALFAGISFLGRFELGLCLGAIEMIMLSLALIIKKARPANSINSILAKHFITYVVAFAFLPLAFIVYLWRHDASRGLLNCLAIPYQLILRHSQAPLPPPCLDLRQIFYGSLFFISVNQHYIPVIVYLVMIIMLMRQYVAEKVDLSFLTALFILLVGVTTFPYALYRVDTTHTMPIIFPALILSGFIFKEAMKKNIHTNSFAYFAKTTYVFIAFLLILLAIKNYDKALKNIITKPFTGKSVLLKTSRGNAYMLKKERDTIKNMIEYVHSNTDKNEKIFIGYDKNSDVFQGGEPMLYFLLDRQPCTKYFIALPGIMNKESTQREIVGSLRDVRLIILTNEGKVVSPDKNIVGSTILDEHIQNYYRSSVKIGQYEVWQKR
jgi:hypothetical protein